METNLSSQNRVWLSSNIQYDESKTTKAIPEKEMQKEIPERISIVFASSYLALPAARKNWH